MASIWHVPPTPAICDKARCPPACSPGRVRMACRLKEELDQTKVREQRLRCTAKDLERINLGAEAALGPRRTHRCGQPRSFNHLPAQEWGRAVARCCPFP